MHCGASTAIMWEPESTDHQLLKDYWMQMQDQLHNKTIRALIVNGEPVNGPNKKSNGDENWTSDVNVQLDCAEKLIRVFRYQDIALTRGSGYHSTDGWTNYEENLARRLGAIRYKGLFGTALKQLQNNKGVNLQVDDGRFGQHTDYYLWMSVNGILFSITHHVGFNRWASYRTTAIAAEMANINHLRGKYFPADMECSQVLRSHVHYLVHVGFGSQYGATIPAWKLADGFVFKGGIAAANHNIGAIEIVVEPNGQVAQYHHTMPNEKHPKYNIWSI